MTEANKNKSRYELFLESSRFDSENHSNALKNNGPFTYYSQVTQLWTLSQNINLNMLIYLFGETIGAELVEQYVTECNKDLIFFFAVVKDNYAFFILHELKNNKELLLIDN